MGPSAAKINASFLMRFPLAVILRQCQVQTIVKPLAPQRKTWLSTPIQRLQPLVPTSKPISYNHTLLFSSLVSCPTTSRGSIERLYCVSSVNANRRTARECHRLHLMCFQLITFLGPDSCSFGDVRSQATLGRPILPSPSLRSSTTGALWTYRGRFISYGPVK